MKKSLNDFVDALDRMMKASEEMHEERRYSNHRHYNSIREKQYEPAKEDLKRALEVLFGEDVSASSGPESTIRESA